MTGHRINWRPGELVWIKRRKKWERRKLHAAFVKKFRRHRDVPFGTFKSLCARAGLRTGRKCGRAPGYSLAYSKAEIAFIRRRRKWERSKLHAAFNAAFPEHVVSPDGFKQICLRHVGPNGRDGRYPKGAVPANKGKKMPFNANSARTQFKKGGRSGRAADLYKPIGTERHSKDGYLERKIHDGMPLQSRWRAVHILNWEQLHGPLPKGHVLKCLDSDKLNTAPSNWQLISRAELASLNRHAAVNYNDAPAELKPTLLAVAKLKTRLHDKHPRQE